MFEQKAKKLIRELYKAGTVTEEMLRDHGFFDKEIAEITDDRDWEIIYDNVSDVNRIKHIQKALESVLGTDWKLRYQFKASSSRNGFNELVWSLSIMLSKNEYDKLCEAVKKGVAEDKDPAIKALEEASALDEITKEMEEHRKKTKSLDPHDLVGDCLEIISRHRAKEAS